MKSLFHGITVAAASGLLLGAAFKPDITFDEAVLGPQILHAAGASAPDAPQPVEMAALAPS
ncbi:hypothetical protein [Phenylobacterium sp.]|uniref:hypothetical protein n=1 Tax=Phenylobacterium sp. TaxID=1871053 RepID=UPI002731D467|nr:hypothetical protein [Phenylobacterium sp.]MDP2215621.1 hypothetical protein [Phenylobacterium sp.]